ncbi:hypothetical protein NL676_023249 [Syzygium grande]|nr:hypothetical protein NL676_023249 [Syzygium grande]
MNLKESEVEAEAQRTLLLKSRECLESSKARWGILLEMIGSFDDRLSMHLGECGCFRKARSFGVGKQMNDTKLSPLNESPPGPSAQATNSFQDSEQRGTSEHRGVQCNPHAETCRSMYSFGLCKILILHYVCIAQYDFNIRRIVIGKTGVLL